MDRSRTWSCFNITLRDNNIAKLQDSSLLDTLIVGGGMGGAATAAALASHGAKIGLIDQGDFGGYTSQESSNLIWGGIKYLESMEFSLVSHLCASRNHLLAAYPATVREIRFFTGVERGFRHNRLTLLSGAWLYWLFGRCKTKRPRLLTRRDMAREEPVIDTRTLTGGFEYSDGYLIDNDTRFTFGFVRRALDYGALAANYVGVQAARRDRAAGIWEIGVIDHLSQRRFNLRARTLINATGPFADTFGALAGQSSDHEIVLSKGIHLLVPRISASRRVLTFFADDGRLFFVIPMGTRSCIGTTDTRVTEHPARVEEADREFVLRNINKKLKLAKPLVPQDIIAERCGVRPLVVPKATGIARDVEWTSLSRRHVIEVRPSEGYAAILGGKLTDCVNIGEEMIRHMASLGISLTGDSFRWYGEAPKLVRMEFLRQASLNRLDELTSPQSSEPLSNRLWRRYGLNAFNILEDIRQDPAMAEVIIKGTEYIRGELYHAAKFEMVATLEDFLRRRSKIALIERRETIRHAPGLKEAAEILFGSDAERQIAAYFIGDGISNH